MSLTVTITAGQTIGQRISDACAAVRAAREQRKAVRQLQSLSHRTLKDIGIDRSEAMSVVYGTANERKRNFRAPASS